MAFVSTGVNLQGAQGTQGPAGNTPAIGPNGNWWIGGADTGLPSRGEDGTSVNIVSSFNTLGEFQADNLWINGGSKGDAVLVDGFLWIWDTAESPPEWTNTGAKIRGEDGVSPHIDGTSGTWKIGSLDTGVKAQGPIGPGLIIKGSVANVGALPLTGQPGDIYFVDGVMYQWQNP